MTFSMSESNKSTKIVVEEEVSYRNKQRGFKFQVIYFQEEDEVAGMSEKEIEEAKKAAKELQSKQVRHSLLKIPVEIAETLKHFRMTLPW